MQSMLPLVEGWSYRGSLGPVHSGEIYRKGPICECCYCVWAPWAGKRQRIAESLCCEAGFRSNQPDLSRRIALLVLRCLVSVGKLTSIPGQKPCISLPLSSRNYPFTNSKYFYSQNISFICPFFCNSIATPVPPLNYCKNILTAPASTLDLTIPFSMELSGSPFTPGHAISCLTHFNGYPLYLG